MLYRLIVLTGPLKNQRITVDSEPMTVGQAPDCELSIPDTEVSQKHAVLEHKPDGGLQIRDLGTMNKLLVNGREMRESRLKHGDMVEIGRTRFLVQAVVKAEVSGQHAADPDEGVSPKVVMAAVLVLILAVVTVVRWPGRNLPPRIEPAVAGVPAAPTTSFSFVESIATDAVQGTTSAPIVEVVAPPVDNQATQITAELRRLRDDLDSIKASQLAQPSNRAPADVVQAPPVIVAPAPPIAIPLESLVVTPASTSAPALSRPAEPPVVASVPTSAPPVPATADPLAVAPAPPSASVKVDTNSPPVVAATPKPKPMGRVLRVLNVEQSRLPPGDDFDDLRAFTVNLAQIDPSVAIDNEQLRVTISFYDEDERTGEVHASAQVAALTDLRPSLPWGADRRGTVTATYALPKGSRANALAAGRSERYHGHVVRVEYAGREQDVWAQPRALTAPPRSSGTATIANGTAPGNPH